MFYKNVQLAHKPYTLHTLTREIQQQSGITFSYDASRVRPDSKVKLKKDRMTVAELLSYIRKKTGIGYKVVSGNHIIYIPPSRKPGRKKPVAARKAIKPKPADWQQRESYPSPPATAANDSLSGQYIMVVGDSATAAGYYFGGGAAGAGGVYTGHERPAYEAFVVDDEEEDDWNDPYGNLAPAKSRFGTPLGQSGGISFLKSSVMIAPLVSVDEIYYLNPGIRAGFDFLYGAVSYNATGPYPHWRYGAGVSVPLNPRWRIALAFNTGRRISQPYNILTIDTIPPSQPDTFELPTIVEKNTPLLVESRLTRVTLSFEWHAGSNFYLDAGLTLNHLRSRYSSENQPVALSDILPIGYDADEKYRTLKPPYLLGNTYQGNTSSNTKIWLGLQLTLIYRLHFFDR